MQKEIERPRRILHELHRRAVTVLRVERPDEHFIRVLFSGESLAGFRSDGFDDHLKFIFATDAGETLSRDYTPYRFEPDRLELSIEFAIHGGGSASLWAQQAEPGQSAVIAGPRGSMLVSPDYDWHLLLGDMTALPAIRRRLRELPSTTQVIVRLLMPGDCQSRALNSSAELDSRCYENADEFITAASTLALPEGQGFIWAAGEAQLMRQLRQILIDAGKHPRQHSRIAAYWRLGSENYHAEID